MGTFDTDRAYGIATDSSGNVYVTGYANGGLDGNTYVGGDMYCMPHIIGDLFVVKYGSSGVKQWTKQLGTSSCDLAKGISTDSSGNVYVTGFTVGGLDGNVSAGGTDIFVVKYDENGNKQ